MRKKTQKQSPTPAVPLSARYNLVIFGAAAPPPQERPARGRPKTKLLIKLIRAAAAEECKGRRYRRGLGPDRYEAAVALLSNYQPADFCGLKVRTVDPQQIKRSHLDVKRSGVEVDLTSLLKKLPLLMRARTDNDVLELLKPNPSGLYYSFDEPRRHDTEKVGPFNHPKKT